MKGVILAGGLGTRLQPLTRVTNKHLLPVYDKPMIFYPVHTLVEAGLTEIMVITGGQSAGDFMRLLGDGSRFDGVHFSYAYQEKEGGIPDALRLARGFAAGGPVAVILGDNFFQGSVRTAVEMFRHGSLCTDGAKIFLKKVLNPRDFGVAEVRDGRVIGIVEKPKEPKSDLAVTGLYLYDNKVFDICDGLTPSGRGELEVTDVNNRYIGDRTMEYEVVDGWWADCGSFEALLRTNILVAKDMGIVI